MAGNIMFQRAALGNTSESRENFRIALRFPVRVVCIGQKLNTIEERLRKKVVCFGEVITRIKATQL
jgi:hypothetical protein